MHELIDRSKSDEQSYVRGVVDLKHLAIVDTRIHEAGGDVNEESQSRESRSSLLRKRITNQSIFITTLDWQELKPKRPHKRGDSLTVSLVMPKQAQPGSNKKPFPSSTRTFSVMSLKLVASVTGITFNPGL